MSVTLDFDSTMAGDTLYWMLNGVPYEVTVVAVQSEPENVIVCDGGEISSGQESSLQHFDRRTGLNVLGHDQGMLIKLSPIKGSERLTQIAAVTELHALTKVDLPMEIRRGIHGALTPKEMIRDRRGDWD